MKILILVWAAAISRDQWTHGFQTHFLESVCSENGALGNLVKEQSTEACLQQVIPPLQECIESRHRQMPNSFNPTAGAAWGKTLGKCTSDRLRL